MDFTGVRIVFVTGKGGVGKSSVAAAIAFRESQKNRRVLLVELGERSFYGPFFGLDEVGQEPVPLANRVDVARWSRDACLREYVLHYLKAESVFKIFFQNRVMRSFLAAAPAVSELALTGKLTSGLRNVGPKLEYDCIVVDAYATGHALALLRGPQGIAEAVSVGPLGENSREIFKLLIDESHCSYVVVATPETLPVVEATELFQELKSSFGINARVVCNRLLAPPISDEEISSMARGFKSREGFEGFVRYLDFKISRQKELLEDLHRLAGPVPGVPLLLETTNQRDMIHKMIPHLERPWMNS